MPILVSFDGVSKEFSKKDKGIDRRFLAVNNVSFQINDGEKVGVVGPNGSGKTTMIKLITGLMQPTSGKINYGKDMDTRIKLNKKIGLMLGNESIYYRLTGRQNLEYAATAYDVKNKEKRIDELAQLLGLDKWLDDYVEKYSIGMKTKLAFCRSILHNPPLLLLDEPTAGIDITTSENMRELIKSLNQTVIITSHNLQDIEDICTRVVVLSKGRIIADESIKTLKSKSRNHFLYALKSDTPLKLISLLKDSFEAKAYGEEILVRIYSKQKLKELLKIASKNDINSISEREISLAEIVKTFTRKDEKE